jgi:citrate lyase beta subunit
MSIPVQQRRIRRSMLLTPGYRRERIEKAMSLGVDAFVFDLEDGVPPSRRAEARSTLAELIPTLDFQGRERVVRINAIGTPDCELDVAALPLQHLDALLVPKVESASQLHLLDGWLKAREAEQGGNKPALQLIVTLETPRGVFNALAIGDATSRTCAFFFGSGDYTMQTGGAITPTSLHWARSTIVAAAGAVGIDAIDAPYLTDLRDPEGTWEDARQARELGFAGKVVFHPAQIEPVHRAFTPSDAEVQRARGIVEAFAQTSARGEAVAIVAGEFVAIDLVPRMERLLQIAAYAQAHHPSAAQIGSRT